ncbi:hypothetical protein HPB49_015703 [Dermacentor silvarum]|uniref:Uncharacterized protein n=1 Tax=Dermacentor silvarum TaxID=543639 RepID=A0ACB8DK32_DERSI|nr:hypothetical protein HPB49_015703 [Dermacentor silvarum]
MTHNARMRGDNEAALKRGSCSRNRLREYPTQKFSRFVVTRRRSLFVHDRGEPVRAHESVEHEAEQPIWLARIKRANLDIENRNLRVCGAHFIAGKPAKLLDETYPDWAPSLLLGYSATNADPSRHQCLEKRRAEKRQADAEKREAEFTELQERRAEADAAATGIQPCAERPLSPHPTGETDADESKERHNQRDTAADALRLCTTS